MKSLCCSLVLILTVSWPRPGAAQASSEPSTRACPRQLEPLVARLLPDLPSYANRVALRSRRSDRDRPDVTYMMLAGRAEFEPLALSPDAPPPSEPQQVFFTTLERQYAGDRLLARQNFYWLFLARADDGWYLAALYYRLGTTEATRPPAPPREASNGTIGRAIQLWLRDCRAGALR